MEIYLYGAGVVAYGVYQALRELFGISVKGFLVTEEEGQPHEIDGIPVYGIAKYQNRLSESKILIAVPEEYQGSIERELRNRSLFHYKRLDSHSEYELMGRYLKKKRELSLIEDYVTIKETPVCDADICVYMAVSHKDKELKKRYQEETWVKKIQVGAALTDERLTELTDEGEDSLSLQNALYGELTASHYAWKHNECEITGLFHYRRVLHVTKEQIQLLKTGKIDVILPLPFVCYPDASGQYKRYILSQDLEIVMQVLKEREKEAYEGLQAILRTPYLYNYNMLIARKAVFGDYCGWLFPLLEEIAKRCEKEKRNRAPRYMGRIGEVLTSLYFMRNEKNWNVTHAGKVWRV